MFFSSPKSCPELKPRPAPVMIMQRTCGSPAACRTTFANSAVIVSFNEFSESGRLSVTVEIWSLVSTRSASYLAAMARLPRGLSAEPTRRRLPLVLPLFYTNIAGEIYFPRRFQSLAGEELHLGVEGWVWEILELLSVPALVACNGWCVASEFALVAVSNP